LFSLSYRLPPFSDSASCPKNCKFVQI
jgi:hypothetical protein